MTKKPSSTCRSNSCDQSLTFRCNIYIHALWYINFVEKLQWEKSLDLQNKILESDFFFLFLASRRSLVKSNTGWSLARKTFMFVRFSKSVLFINLADINTTLHVTVRKMSCCCSLCSGCTAPLKTVNICTCCWRRVWAESCGPYWETGTRHTKLSSCTTLHILIKCSKIVIVMKL